MRGIGHKKDRNKCEVAPRAPVQTIQKSEADVELAIFSLFTSQTTRTARIQAALGGGKAASQQVDTQKLLSSKEK